MVNIFSPILVVFWVEFKEKTVLCEGTYTSDCVCSFLIQRQNLLTIQQVNAIIRLVEISTR